MIDNANITEIGHDLNDLKFRRILTQSAIKVLDNLTDVELEFYNSSDKVRKIRMTEKKQELASIDEQIKKITGSPPPVVVGLKTASLFGDADMKKGGTNG